MSLFATLRCWWRVVVDRARTQDDVEAEFQFHIDAYAQDLIRRGLPQAEARRKAIAELGQPGTQKERYREAIGLRIFDEIGADVRYGLRALLRNPGFSAVAILSLALGVGATTAMFSLIDAVLIHPFPYADSDRIMNPVLINEQDPQQVTWFALNKSQFETLSHAKPVESLLGFRNGNMEITGDRVPEDVAAIYLTENADTFFGVRALLGRGIQPSDAQGAAQPVVVLSYKLWKRYYSGDPGVIGRTMQLEHATYTIVGVMPRRFTFNDTLGVGDLYLPRTLLHDNVNPAAAGAYTPWIKLKANVSVAAADAELDAIVHQFAKENPAHFPQRFHLQLQRIAAPFEQNLGHTLVLLSIAVLMLLLIGCANCSILLLARGRARQHELAVRSAIGASRWRIVRQLLVESIVLSLCGAALGVAASYWLATLPVRLSPDSFPSESLIQINLAVLTFSVLLALGCGVLFGLVPAVRLSRPDVSHLVQRNLRGITGRGRRQNVNILIAGQIAVTLVLIATAGTAIGAFLRLLHTPLGYEPRNVMQVGILMHWNQPEDWEKVKSREGRVAFLEQIRRKIASIPGVSSVAVGTDATPPNTGRHEVFDTLLSERGQRARMFGVGPEYFSTLRIPLLRGRIWNETENMHGDSVALVNESFARRYWPLGNAIDQQIRIPGLTSVGPLVAASSDSGGWRTIVGVVGDVRNDGVDMPVLPAIYTPYTTLMVPYAQFMVRTQGEPLSLLASVQAAVQSVSADQQVSKGAFDLTDAIEHDAQWSRQRLLSVLFGFFSVMALILALVGLFSVVSYSVAQRIPEFGVRLALGAPRSHIVWLAARIAALSVAAGMVAGLLADVLVAKILAKWMSHGGLGLSTLWVAVLLLTCSAIVACLIPAHCAASVQPVEALRYE